MQRLLPFAKRNRGTAHAAVPVVRRHSLNSRFARDSGHSGAGNCSLRCPIYSDPPRGHQTAANTFNFSHIESRSSESASRKSDSRLDLAIV